MSDTFKKFQEIMFEKLSGKELTELTDIPTVVINRENYLPHEQRFANLGVSPVKFSTPELSARENSINNLLIRHLSTGPLSSQEEADFKSFAEYQAPSPFAWAISNTINQPWNQENDAFAAKLFGKKPWAEIRGMQITATKALVCPISPFVDEKSLFCHFSGLPVPERLPSLKGLKKIITQHEIGHSFYPLAYDGTPFVKYASETLADCFAIESHLALRADETGVKDFISMRRLGQFFGRAQKWNWTASACEACLKGTQSPPLEKIEEETKELRDAIVPDLPPGRMFAHADLSMESLVRVLARAPTDLSEGALELGEKVVGAYERFYPQKTAALLKKAGKTSTLQLD